MRIPLHVSMLFGVVVAAQLFQGVLGARVFDDADCE